MGWGAPPIRGKRNNSGLSWTSQAWRCHGSESCGRYLPFWIDKLKDHIGERPSGEKDMLHIRVEVNLRTMMTKVLLAERRQVEIPDVRCSKVLSTRVVLINNYCERKRRCGGIQSLMELVGSRGRYPGRSVAQVVV